MTTSNPQWLAADEFALLRDAVGLHAPELDELVDRIGILRLQESEREALRTAVLSEFLLTGLDSDDEPTARGLRLESLIDALGRC